MHDVVVIGSGPAGMTAAVYTARKKLDTLVIAQFIGGQVAESMWVENSPGLEPATGVQLTEKFYKQMLDQGAQHAFDEVVSMEEVKGGFRVHTKLRKSYEGRAVIIASGTHPRRLNVPGEADLIGRGISHCTTCDAPAFMKASNGKPSVGIVGGGNSGLLAAVELLPAAKEVHVVSMDPWWGDQVYQERLLASRKVHRYERYTVERFHGSEWLEGMTIRAVETGRAQDLAVKAAFVEIGAVPTSDFADKRVEKTRAGHVVVDNLGRTNVPGIFAAGDVTPVRDREIATAAGAGATAALSAFEYLSKQKA